jgi:uncharacterized protein (TIGR02265 family)
VKGVEKEKLIFDNAVDGLFRALSGRMTPALIDRLRDVGLDLKGKRKPGYTLEEWRAILRVTREELFPGLAAAIGYRRLGELFIDGYMQTVLGSAVAGLLRLLGPKRTLVRATQNFRSANNYTETKLTELGPNHFELWMNEVDNPDFTMGIILRGIVVAGGKDGSVRVISHDAQSCVFDVTWN